MPIFMDRHDGVHETAAELALLHAQDLRVAEKYHANFLTYWFDPNGSQGFCLLDAPSEEIANQVHLEAHGQVADRVIAVDQTVVEAFLGSIGRTAGATQHFHVETPPPPDPVFRTIMFTDIAASTAITQQVGDAAAMSMVHTHDAVVREALGAHAGAEVKHTGDGIMACFRSASSAVQAAIDIQVDLAARAGAGGDVAAPVRVRVGLSAGEPVSEHDDLFGATVQLASRVCNFADPGQILAANVIHDLCIGKDFVFSDQGEVTLKGFEEPVRAWAVAWESAPN